MIFLGDVKMISGGITKIEETGGRNKVVTLFIPRPRTPDLEEFDSLHDYEMAVEEFDINIHIFNRLYTGDVQLLQEI